MDNKRIIEALKIQPLTEEEKTRRHILGRLYGPIATCTESTRNGRKYNRQLWEKALSDEIFREKVAKKSLFLEFSHPTDREETDPLKACACIPELPRIIDGDLYAYVDILDTPSGKILKTLVDYGFEPGISSRGSGDIMANDEVDPETFFLETWDIVQLPAVKKARLSVCESFNGKKNPLKQALTEALNEASEEDKESMKQTLNDLDINLDEKDPEVEGETLPGGTPVDDAEIPMADETNDAPGAPETLTEADEEPEAEETEEEEVEEETEETSEEDTEESDVEINTIDDLIKSLGEFDKDLPIEFAPVNIEGVDYNVDLFMDGDDEKVTLGVNCTPVENNENIDPEAELPEEENPEAGVVIDASSDEGEVVIEPTDDTEPAVDNGDEEVMESLKDLVRQKDLLESEVKALKKAQAVSNAEASKLKEQLDQYKTGFARTSELAGQATKAKKEVANLTEQLAQKTALVESLEKKVAEKQKLTESVNNETAKVKQLTEQLKTAATNTKTLTEQMNQCKRQLAESQNAAKQYKNKFTVVLNRYIESKAKMLGVRPGDITNRLNESYTLDDIDNVCDELMMSTVNVGRLPFNQKQVKAKINESATPKSFVTPEEDDLTDLYALAGIKK